MGANDYTSVVNDKRGLARDQLNLPIARAPIDIQSSIPMRSTHHPVGRVPSPKATTMPSTTTATTMTHIITSHVSKQKAAHKTARPTFPSTTKGTNAVQGEDQYQAMMPF